MASVRANPKIKQPNNFSSKSGRLDKAFKKPANKIPIPTPEPAIEMIAKPEPNNEQPEINFMKPKKKNKNKKNNNNKTLINSESTLFY